MTDEYSNVHYWNSPPDRDEALRVIYRFLKAMSDKRPDEAMTYLLVKDMPYFQQVLHDTILKYLEMIVEDEEFEDFSSRNLALEITDPELLNEDDTTPEFSGRHFVLNTDETVSLYIGINGQVTPIRLHFSLINRDELYYLMLSRITVS